MGTVNCKRCQNEQTGFDEPPMPGKMGEKVRDGICQACWKEWMELSTKIINENRLQLFRPEHRKVLEKQMEEFLNLRQ